MNAHRTATLSRPINEAEAREHVESTALTASGIGPVGLELEFHVVDLERPDRRVGWPQLSALIAAMPPLPNATPITTEPGGQLELSGAPAPDVATAIMRLEQDIAVLRDAAAARGFGLASLGADPARPLGRVTPADRYRAMEQHFDAMGCGDSGRRMMSSTAALQVNLDAGPADEWADRIAFVHRIGPILSAISACSPMIAGMSSGWASMRAQAWLGIDGARTGPFARVSDPVGGWADYALAAPVMLVRDAEHDSATAMTQRVPFGRWASHPELIGRAPSVEDLDYHLTTLFPPVRTRGYLELRFLDAVPDAWWPALAAIVVTLIDNPQARALAMQRCRTVDNGWARAAKDGLADPELLAAARECTQIAAACCPLELRPPVQRYAALVDSGRTPGTELRALIDAGGPLQALIEAAHA